MSQHGYFDYNATTPVGREAIDTFQKVLSEFGNPSSTYGLATSPKNLLKNARQQVARLIGAGAEEVFFTSGGTEANNWAIKGALISRGVIGRSVRPAHIVVSEIEHSSVLAVAEHLERVFGIEVTRVAPDREGLIQASTVVQSLRPNTQLAAIMLVNNEVGTIQPIAEIAQALRDRSVHLHVDGVQAVGKMEVDVHRLGVDTLSFAGHKFYGPKGVGGLYIRAGVTVEPLIHGGGQERGQRGGTESVAAIAAMGAAADATYKILPELIARLTEYRELLRAKLLERVRCVAFNGPSSLHELASNTLSVRVDGCRAEALAAVLDNIHGIQVSLGSACSNNKTMSLSHVLQAMGLSESEIKATLRISIGQYTEEAHLDAFVSAVAEGLRTLERFGQTGESRHAIAA